MSRLAHAQEYFDGLPDAVEYQVRQVTDHATIVQMIRNERLWKREQIGDTSWYILSIQDTEIGQAIAYVADIGIVHQAMESQMSEAERCANMHAEHRMEHALEALEHIDAISDEDTAKLLVRVLKLDKPARYEAVHKACVEYRDQLLKSMLKIQ